MKNRILVPVTCAAILITACLASVTRETSVNCEDPSTDSDMVYCVESGQLECDQTDALGLVDCNALKGK